MIRGFYLRGFKNTMQKMKFSVKGLSRKCDQIRKNLRIWSHLLKKSLLENFIFYAVKILRQELKENIRNKKEKHILECLKGFGYNCQSYWRNEEWYNIKAFTQPWFTYSKSPMKICSTLTLKTPGRRHFCLYC